MSTKSFFISIVVTLILVMGAVSYVRNGTSISGAPGAEATAGNNIEITDGIQYIDIDAKGGYSPRKTVAQAGVPTIIRMNTRGTFDCSSSLVIPKLEYKGFLKPSGVTEIEVPAQESGSVINGLCSMGMYNFAVEFQ
ncbi:MAG: Copper-exporting ATPase [Parcubacteria group bacterium GW2011_GWA2_47_7]|nr:MAG: Copper-exporting ATPase [Parcubacteria group bacterium GW2011_GWA2_47_7]